MAAQLATGSLEVREGPGLAQGPAGSLRMPQRAGFVDPGDVAAIPGKIVTGRGLGPPPKVDPERAKILAVAAAGLFALQRNVGARCAPVSVTRLGLGLGASEQLLCAMDAVVHAAVGRILAPTVLGLLHLLKLVAAVLLLVLGNRGQIAAIDELERTASGGNLGLHAALMRGQRGVRGLVGQTEQGELGECDSH